MAVGSALRTTVTLKKETSFGIKDTDTDNAILFSRTQFTPKLDQQTILSKEIKRSMQSGNFDRGTKTVTATLSGELEAGAHSALWASLLRQEFNTGVVSSIVGTDVSTVAQVANLTTNGSDWIGDSSLAVGDTIRFNGFTGSNKVNNGRNWVILAVTSSTMKVRAKDGRYVMFADAAGELVTITNVDKLSFGYAGTGIAAVADTAIFESVAGNTSLFAAGDTIKVTGFTGGNAGNNDKPFKITKLTSNTIFGYYNDNSLPVNDAATESVTITKADVVRMTYSTVNALAIATTSRLTSSTSFIAEGFKIHDVIRLGGFSNSTNNNRNLLITSFNAAGTQLNFSVLDADATDVPIAVESAVSGSNVYRVGKKAFIPQDNHTNNSWTAERWDDSILQSERYIGLRVGQGKVTCSNADIPSVSFDFMGKDLETAQAEYFTSSTEPNSSKNLSVIFGKVVVGTTVLDAVMTFDITVSANLSALDKCVGSSTAKDVTAGGYSVKGSMQIYYENEVERDRFINNNENSLCFILRESDAYSANFVALQMPRIIYDSAQVNDDIKASTVTIPFTALENLTGSDGTESNKLMSTFSIQDSKA